MIEIQILLIIIVIIFILNNIKFKKVPIKNTKSNNVNYSQDINYRNYINYTEDTYNIENKLYSNNNKYKDLSYKLNNKSKIKNYGQIQYDVINYDNDSENYKYQNLDIIKKNKILPLSENINQINKYNDLTKLNNNFDPSQNKFIKQTVTNLPSQQDIIYDTKFYQPSDANIYKPSDLSKINYTDKKIEDIYNEIVNSNNVDKNKKKLKEKINEFTTGASGLKTYNNMNWEYEGENNDISFDPMVSLLSTF